MDAGNTVKPQPGTLALTPVDEGFRNRSVCMEPDANSRADTAV